MEGSTPTAAVGRRLPYWGFALAVVAYLALIQGIGIVLQNAAELGGDGRLDTLEDVLLPMTIPLVVALAFVYGLIAYLGWWRPVFHETHRVQRWVIVVPLVFILAIVVGIDYGALADRGLGFVLLLLLTTQLVGWGEEGMFRGIGVEVLRQHGLTEGKVALWSSIIFGLVHLSNVLGRGASAIPQAIAVSLAGYFFYLIRRRSGSNVLNSVLHGLFDFTLLSGAAIDDTFYPLTTAGILVYVVLGLVLLVRRHHIDVPDDAPEPATSERV